MSDTGCPRFIERLDAFVSGRLEPAERRAAEEHLASCDECRALRTMAAAAGGADAPPPGLVAAVLARTSGPTCGSARARLCDDVDRLLPPADEELVRSHLEGCDDCFALAAALARLAADLPLLAESEPGPRFLADVLGRTSRRAAPAARVDAFSGGWRRLARRPRIAWEGAYAASLLVLMLFGAPNAPLAGMPARALDLVRTVESLPAEAARTTVPRLRVAARARWTEAAADLGRAARDVKGRMARRSREEWTALRGNLGTLWERLASGGQAPGQGSDGGR